MAYVSVDLDGNEFVKDIDEHGIEISSIMLPKGYINRMVGREISYIDGCVELVKVNKTKAEYCVAIGEVTSVCNDTTFYYQKYVVRITDKTLSKNHLSSVYRKFLYRHKLGAFNQHNHPQVGDIVLLRSRKSQRCPYFTPQEALLTRIIRRKIEK